MSDNSAACITIGGSIHVEKLPTLIEAILDQGVGPDYDDYFDTAEEVEEYLRSDGEKNLFDSEARGGEFPELEAVLRDLGLTYNRGDDGHYTYSPSVEYWEPGLPNPVCYTGSCDSHVPHLSLSQFRSLTPDELAVFERASASVPAFSIVA